jgi:crotonobetainyl-CoA:carnitine CoA-transferase CaiB-like acyl-CoA transferase
LDGVHVLELSSFISASFAGTVLGDFGADVVKIELPGKGDLQRGLGTFTTHDDERSLWWMSLSRNKRSVALDLRSPESRPIIRRLVSWADVVTENFRPGTLEGWGIGWNWIHEVNPVANLLRVSGYGQTGPYREQASVERVAQAFGGLMYLTGEPGGPPQKAGLPICDYTTGMWGAIGILLTLVNQLRGEDVEGQVIDHAIYESIIPLLKDVAAVYELTGEVAQRVGNRSANVAPGEAYLTRDNHWLFIAPTGDNAFLRVMHAIGHDEIADNPRFATTNDRVADREPLDRVMTEWTRDHDRGEVMATMAAAGVPCAAVQSIADLLDDPQVQARQDFLRTHDERIGDVTIPNVVPRLSETPGGVRRNAPRVGEHTDEVLVGDLGMDPDEVERLRSGGVVQ